jgi:cyclohexadienyl dehydratase
VIKGLIALALLAPAWAAAGTLDTVKSAGVLRIGTPGDYRPYAIRGTDGSVAGAEVDLAKGFAAQLGVRADFVPTSWKTMADDFMAHKFDLVVGGVSVTPERAQLGDFSVALSEDGKRPVVRCSDKDRYTTLEAIDRPEVRVVVNLGGTNEAFARARLNVAPISIETDNVTVPDQLLGGAQDVFVTDGAEVDLLARHFPGRLCAAAVVQPFTHLTKAWWLQKDDAFKQAVDAFLAGAKGDGSWQAALDRAMQSM